MSNSFNKIRNVESLGVRSHNTIIYLDIYINFITQYVVLGTFILT